MTDVRILANALGGIGDVPSAFPLSMHREALPSFQPRERLCLGRGSTDTMPFYSITMKAFSIQEVEFYNIDGVF